MRNVSLYLLLFFATAGAFGQTKVNGKLTGPDGQPIPFANVLLLSSADSSLVKGTLTNEQGAYQLADLKQGNYMLRFSSMGYQTWNSPAFDLSGTPAGRDFGSQVLAAEVTQLEAIEVRGQKPLYQQEIDRMVINVQSSPLTKGSSALQVLERSPGVYIGRQNNNIALNGKNSVMVMVNGKLMRLPLSQVVALLNSMSADNVDRIELLTTPPAKYDAEGSAGMINIVMKKNETQGTKGSFSLTGGYGRGEKAAGSLDLTHNTGKINTYGSYSFMRDRSYSDWFADAQSNIPVLGGPLSTDFWSATLPTQTSHNATLGFDVTLGKTTLGSSINYNSSLLASDTTNRGEYSIEPDSFLLLKVQVDGVSRWQNAITNFYVERQLGEGEKITFDADYLYYKNESPTNIYTAFYDRQEELVELNGDLFASRQRGLANTPIRVGVTKLDYVKQLNRKLRFEAGLKGTYTWSSSVSGIESLAGEQWVSSQTTSNATVMREGIGAAYTSFHWQVNPTVNLVAGARYEYSDTQMNAEKKENEVNRRFGKLFPSVFLSKKLTDQSDLQFSYTKRIGRPTYNDLASFITYTDPISVMTGNPALRAVVTNNLKVGYNYQGYSFSVTASRDDFPIARFQATANPQGDLMYISPQNVEYQNNLTFQTNLPWRVTNWWSMNAGFVGGWRQFRLAHTAEKLEKTYFAYSAYGSQTFTLPANFLLEISGWYNSLQFDGSKKVEGFGVVNAGVKKELPGNRGTLQLSVTDLFKSLTINSYFGHLTPEVFDMRSHVTYNAESAKARIVKLTYARSFGNTKVSGQKQRGVGSKDERDRVRKE